MSAGSLFTEWVNVYWHIQAILTDYWTHFPGKNLTDETLSDHEFPVTLLIGWRYFSGHKIGCSSHPCFSACLSVSELWSQQNALGRENRSPRLSWGAWGREWRHHGAVPFPWAFCRIWDKSIGLNVPTWPYHNSDVWDRHLNWGCLNKNGMYSPCLIIILSS